MDCKVKAKIEVKPSDTNRDTFGESWINNPLNNITVPQMNPDQYYTDNAYCKTEFDSRHSIIKQNRNCENSTSFEVINFWYGVVTDVNEDGFDSEIFDVQTNNEELLNFDFNEIPKNDKNLVEEGATFQLFLGYLYSEYGQRTRSTIVIFDRYAEIPSLEKSYAEIKNYRTLAEKLKPID